MLYLCKEYYNYFKRYLKNRSMVSYLTQWALMLDNPLTTAGPISSAFITYYYCFLLYNNYLLELESNTICHIVDKCVPI